MQTVTSADGTQIAFERSGVGSPLVLVHGTSTVRAPWASIFDDHFTVVAMDRRGRGDSGDGPHYSIEREFEDVVAVVEQLDAPVLLFGHSYGALCALGAALQTNRLVGLIVYEPGLSDGETLYSPGQLAKLNTLLDSGDAETMLAVFMREVVGMPQEEVELLASSPAWSRRVATAHTIPRELHAEETYRLPSDRAGALSIPVLLVKGGDSPPELGAGIEKLQRILPNARTAVLPGQQHVAMYTAPDILVRAVVDFWREIAPRA